MSPLFHSEPKKREKEGEGDSQKDVIYRVWKVTFTGFGKSGKEDQRLGTSDWTRSGSGQ